MAAASVPPRVLRTAARLRSPVGSGRSRRTSNLFVSIACMVCKREYFKTHALRRAPNSRHPLPTYPPAGLATGRLPPTHLPQTPRGHPSLPSICPRMRFRLRDHTGLSPGAGDHKTGVLSCEYCSQQSTPVARYGLSACSACARSVECLRALPHVDAQVGGHTAKVIARRVLYDFV